MQANEGSNTNDNTAQPDSSQQPNDAAPPARYFWIVKQGKYMHGFDACDGTKAKQLFQEKARMRLNPEMLLVREEPEVVSPRALKARQKKTKKAAESDPGPQPEELAQAQTENAGKPTRCLYLHLFHGRKTTDEIMEDWGSDGPTFGPYDYIHHTYATRISMGREGEGTDDLAWDGDSLVFYNGIYYGDFSVFSLADPAEVCADEFVQENARPR